VVSTVVTFPSAETVTLEAPMTLPPFFRVAAKWLESVRLAEMVSAPLGMEPEMGLSCRQIGRRNRRRRAKAMSLELVRSATPGERG
jgi:hypothetical protein